MTPQQPVVASTMLVLLPTRFAGRDKMRAHHTPPFLLLLIEAPASVRFLFWTIPAVLHPLEEDAVRAGTFCPRPEVPPVWQGVSAQRPEFLHRGLRPGRSLLRLRRPQGR